MAKCKVFVFVLLAPPARVGARDSVHVLEHTTERFALYCRVDLHRAVHLMIMVNPESRCLRRPDCPCASFNIIPSAHRRDTERCVPRSPMLLLER